MTVARAVEMFAFLLPGQVKCPKTPARYVLLFVYARQQTESFAAGLDGRPNSILELRRMTETMNRT